MENLSKHKELINNYINFSIQQQFRITVDLKDEYTFTENLVSKKPIIATTFSDKILADSEIKMFLTSLITEINTGNCSTEMMRNQLEADSQEMQEMA